MAKDTKQSDGSGSKALRDYIAVLQKSQAALIEKMKTGDIDAGRKAGSCKSDIVSLVRIADRLDDNYYQ